MRHLMWLSLAAMSAPAFASGREERDQRFYDTRVAPILRKRCLGCHNQELNNGGISFLDRDSLIRGGRLGPAIVPGRPEKSALVDVLRHEGEIQMPPGPKLPAREIRILTDWIRRGAVWGAPLR
jgi:cytochrome c